MKNSKVKKVAYLSIFVSLALIVSYIESQIPTFIPVPGIKLGLPNIVIIFFLYKTSAKDAVIVNILRVFISALLFGNMVSLLYSISGAFLSLTLMIILKKLTKLSKITVSVIGGVSHNIGQIIMASIVTSTAELVYYLPALLISGTISGIVIGIVSAGLVKKLENVEL